MQLSYAAQINKLINILMKRGKRDKDVNILHKALFFIKRKTKKSPYYILRKALLNATPVIGYDLKKKGTNSYQIPSPLEHHKAVYIAITCILFSAKKRSSSSSKPKLKHNFPLRLCDELIDVSRGIGFAVRQKQDIYDIVLRNRFRVRRRSFKNYNPYRKILRNNNNNQDDKKK